MRRRTSPQTPRLLVATGALLMLVSLTAPTSPATATTPQKYPPVTLDLPLHTPCEKPTTLTTIPPADQQKTEELLGAFAGSAYQGGGPCPNGLIQIMLAPGSEQLAKRISKVFGPRVVIFIAEQLWQGKPLRSPTCGTLPPPSRHPALSAVLDLKSTTIRAGANLIGTVVVKDISAGPATLAIGQPIQIVLTKLGSRRVVGIYEGAIAGTAFGHTFEPNGTVSVNALGGSARCDGGLGSVLPAGRYDAIAEVTGPAVDEPIDATGALVFTNAVPVRIR